MFSIIIPTYNRSAILRKSIQSIADSHIDSREYEVIVVNDCGEPTHYDTTYLSENAGPATARNIGYSLMSDESTGALFIGDDIILDPYALLHLSSIIQSHPEAAVQGYVTWHPKVVTPFMSFLEEGIQSNFGALSPEDPALKVITGFGVTTFLYVPRRALELTGGFVEEFESAAWEDIEFCDRLAQYGVKTVFTSRVRAYHYHKYTVDRYIDRQVNEGHWRLTYAKHRPQNAANLLDPNGIRAKIDLETMRREAVSLENLVTSNQQVMDARKQLWGAILSTASFVGVQREIDYRGGLYNIFKHIHTPEQIVLAASLIRAMESHGDETGFLIHGAEWLQSKHSDNWAAWAASAEIFLRTEDYVSALRCMSKAVSMAPGEAWTKDLKKRVELCV